LKAGKDSADAEGVHCATSEAFGAARRSIRKNRSGGHFAAIKIARIGKSQRLPRQMSLLSCMQQSKIGTMQRLQAFKYELRPNGEQQRNMGRFAGSRRFVYNKDWHCKRPTTRLVAHSSVTWRWQSC
jgi:hypothetical protein